MAGLGSAQPLTPAFAATTVTHCPTTEAALFTDITNAGSGGMVAFNCTRATTIPFIGSITISQDVTLDASGAQGSVTFLGSGPLTRFFFVASAVTGVRLSLIHLTLQHGSYFGGPGAIWNNGGTLTITDSTFSANGTASDVGGGGGQGGAIWNYGGMLTITDSTFSGNSAGDGGATSNSGGAIWNSGGTQTITDSTVSGNSAVSGGAISNSGGTVSIGGSIIANSGGGNCSGPITDNGYNLTDSNGDCGLTATTDLTNTDPQLDPNGLQPNGGPTPTIALLSTSPAIDANSCSFQDANGTTITMDQRGDPRPDEGQTACDIGAYKSSGASTTWTFSLDETGLPATVPHQATVDNQTLTLPFSTTVVDGSTHTYGYPATVADPTPGTRYVTTDAGGSVTVSQNVAHTATYTTQRLLTVSTSGLGSNNTHIGNGTTVLGTATDSSPLTTWLADGTTLSLSADALVTNPNGTQYFVQGFTPTPPSSLSAPVATTASYLTMGQIVRNLGLSSSYADQWTTVQGDIASAQYATALGDLKGFINHMGADSRVPPAEATPLQLDALPVYHNQICPALAAGQIGQTAASHDYAYYKTTVTSLGGTPLPAAC